MSRWPNAAIVETLFLLVAMPACLAPTAAFASCGDGAIDAGEECDDGNLFGGDGCAANCTGETVRSLLIDPARSTATTQLKRFKIEIPISGEVKLTTGGLGADGLIPLVVRSENLTFAPIPVTGLACVCIRSRADPELFGPGNVGSGGFGCGGTGTFPSDLSMTQDHNTDDVDPDCGAGTREGPEDRFPGVCNGPVNFSFTSNGPLGSMGFIDNIAFSIILDGGSCEPNGDVPDNGPDGVPCTGDDPNQADGANVPIFTGTARGAIYDADNEPGSDIAVGETCGPDPCQAEITGRLFDCDALLGNPTGGLEGGVLVSAFPILNYPGAGDAVVTLSIVPEGAPSAACPGDCNGNGEVTVDELVKGVNIALDTAAVDVCPAVDTDASGRVEINELVAAVNRALAGCSQI